MEGETKGSTGFCGHDNYLKLTQIASGFLLPPTSALALGWTSTLEPGKSDVRREIESYTLSHSEACHEDWRATLSADLSDIFICCRGPLGHECIFSPDPLQYPFLELR